MGRPRRPRIHYIFTYHQFVEMPISVKTLDSVQEFGNFQHMMNNRDSVKHLEDEAVDAARGLLDDIPRLTVIFQAYSEEVPLGQPIDGRIDFKHGDHVYALMIRVERNGAPRFARSSAYLLKGYLAHPHELAHTMANRRVIPMLVSPYLSRGSRSVCREHEVAYLDLVGNAHLAFDSVLIDREVAESPKSETRALRSMFTPKAAAILRVMLRDPNRAWRVAGLAQETNVSLGHVSNVRRALLDREWIQEQDDGVVLVEPGALLRTWRENYRRRTRARVAAYTHLHGKELDQRLQGQLNPYPDHPRAIYAVNSAAQWFAPFARAGTTHFYADEPGLDRLNDLLELRPAARGANVIVRIPADESLFGDVLEPVPGIFCTSPVVTYLDLWNGSDRDREAAEHLAEEWFPWL